MKFLRFLFLLVSFLLVMFVTANADTIKLTTAVGTDGSYTLVTPDGRLSYTAFCLNKDFTTSSAAIDYNTAIGNVYTGSSSIDLKAMYWIATQNQHSVEDRQRAIWGLTNGISLTPFQSQLVANAFSSSASVDLSQVTVLVPVDPKIQPFLVTGKASSTSQSPVPEPATLFLLGSGLFGVATRIRKKRKQV